MSHTDQYEHLLDRENVVGIEWDEDQKKVIVYVTEKLPEDLLNDEDVVANNLNEGEESDVIDAGGEPRLESSDSTEKHRPVLAGVSEGPASSNTAGTGGPIAVVRDPQKGNGRLWADHVEKGDYVRLSNNHVFAGATQVPENFSEVICQPAGLDGGSLSQGVGDLVGYVPLSDRGTVDCAARTITGEDVNGVHEIDRYPTGIRRDYGNIRGEELTKSGRTTGVTSAPVQATSATVRVRISEDQTLTFRDQLITGDMSDSGDSGSAVFDEDGQLTGLLFAGSDQITILNKITNVEAEFGVEMEADPVGNPSSPPEPRPEPFELTIGTGEHIGSVEYSFEVSDDSTVDYSGHSASMVDNRLIGWILIGWTKTFTIDGEITDASIPDGASVKLNGEPISPDEVVERSQELVE